MEYGCEDFVAVYMVSQRRLLYGLLLYCLFLRFSMVLKKMGGSCDEDQGSFVIR